MQWGGECIIDCCITIVSIATVYTSHSVRITAIPSLTPCKICTALGYHSNSSVYIMMHRGEAYLQQFTNMPVENARQNGKGN